MHRDRSSGILRCRIARAFDLRSKVSSAQYLPHRPIGECLRWSKTIALERITSFSAIAVEQHSSTTIIHLIAQPCIHVSQEV
ncbi:MAG: hypothetical protein M3R08_11255 [Bacteroidota bacterium]|nr:hypothetical protein [Bacteroidota bacterium]